MFSKNSLNNSSFYAKIPLFYYNQAGNTNSNLYSNSKILKSNAFPQIDISPVAKAANLEIKDSDSDQIVEMPRVDSMIKNRPTNDYHHMPAMIDQKMNIRKKGAVNKSPTQPSQTLSASSKDDKTTTSSIDTLGLRSDEIMSKYFKIYFTINPATSAQYKLISNSGNFKIYQKLFKFTESNSMELLIIGKMMVRFIILEI